MSVESALERGGDRLRVRYILLYSLLSVHFTNKCNPHVARRILKLCISKEIKKAKKKTFNVVYKLAFRQF